MNYQEALDFLYDSCPTWDYINDCDVSDEFYEQIQLSKVKLQELINKYNQRHPRYLPCTCGNKRRKRTRTKDGWEISCMKCDKKVYIEGFWSDTRMIKAWNKMIEEENEKSRRSSSKRFKG